MPSRITKDFQKVFDAFSEGKEAMGGKVSMGGGSGVRCRTDGHNFYSYDMLVAKRFHWLDFGTQEKTLYVVIDREYGPSVTTKRHIDALMSVIDGAQIVREGSIMTWDFKFSGNY